MEFRVLGEVEALVDGVPIDIGPARQRCVLAVLLLEANRPVSVEILVDRVWGGRRPQRAREMIHSYMSRLRRSLAGTSGRIARAPGGYRLTVDEAAVDVHRFRDLVRRSRASDEEAPLDEALGLWRGRPFGDADTPWLNAVRDALAAERVGAQLDRNDGLLRRGGHAALLVDLSSAVTDHPLDERMAAQLMTALYRSGRQADALDVYDRIRHRLADDLGADPSPPLRQVHQQILTADPALAAPPPPAPAPVRERPIPRQLPAAPPTFTGRTLELAELDKVMADRLGTVVVSAIGGAGGIGKTWLALRWCHDNVERFPDGQLYVDLRGFDPSSQPLESGVAVRAFLGALGAPRESIPVDPDARAALYRTMMAGRRMLVLLDNARDTAQVAPLLPGSASCAVVVTSRHTLGGLVTAHGARSLRLDVLTDADARRLLVRHLGPDRMESESEPVAALLRRCAGLPLALAIVAARATIHPDLPLAALADELLESTMDALDAGEVAANLRAVLSCSCRAIRPEAADMFRLLGLASGPDIGLAAVASLAALPATRVRSLLGELGAAHLVQEHRPGRYRMHDLVRLFATEQADALADERPTAVRRLLDHYLHTARAADRLLGPHRDPVTVGSAEPGVAPENFTDYGQALAWFVAEHLVLLAAVEQSARDGFGRHTWQLAVTIANFLYLRGLMHDQVVIQTTAIQAARRLADRPGQANAHRGLANAYNQLGRYDDARTHLHHARDMFAALGDQTGQAHTLLNLSHVLTRMHAWPDALDHAHAALELYQTVGKRTGQANALNGIGWLHAQVGDHQQALRYCEQALALHQELGYQHGEALTWDSLGFAHHNLGHHDEAVACYQQAIDLYKDLGQRRGEADTLTNLGDTHRVVGNRDAARHAFRHALAILDDLGQPDAAESVRVRLAEIPAL